MIELTSGINRTVPVAVTDLADEITSAKQHTTSSPLSLESISQIINKWHQLSERASQADSLAVEVSTDGDKRESGKSPNPAERRERRKQPGNSQRKGLAKIDTQPATENGSNAGKSVLPDQPGKPRSNGGRR